MISRPTLLISALIITLSLTMGPLQHEITSMSRDYWPTNEWREVAPEVQGLNSSLLGEMLQYINDHSMDIDSISIIRNGYLVLNELPSGNYDGEGLHVLASVAKSVSSALVGIVIDLGYISNLSQRVIDFFPDRTIANMDNRKESWTLEHLLTMTSGLSWDETSYSYESPMNSYFQLTQSDDWIQFMLDLPMEAEPGIQWEYNSGSIFLISPIIEGLTGMTLGEFAEEYLFDPIGITDYYWEQNPDGYFIAGGHFGLTALDLAKIGYLFLNNGTWDNKQVISREWIRDSIGTQYSFSETKGYGHLWWTMPDINAFYALGAYNQHLIVLPDYDLVVSVTASIAYGNPVLLLVRNYILPSITGPTQSIPIYIGPVTILISTLVIVSVIGISIVVLLKRR
ncbi:MAG: serine hydrolase domain-containing protein [Candidatus Thorarchaeota archaeon]